MIAWWWLIIIIIIIIIITIRQCPKIPLIFTILIGFFKEKIKVVAWFFRLSSLRRRHARQRAAGRAGRRAQWEVWYFDHA